uniref:ATP-dependent DNA helicase n=1 Tax=Trichogramma kaykai TaxID=54128 RepID=A0ABD2WVZ8_9HYME
MNLLNKKQREIVMHVLHSFKTDKLPLRIFINGSAGVGKSTVINTLYQLLTIQFNEQPGENTENNKILLCAPSGKAAYLIGGITCHHAFALPVTKNGQKMKPLSEDIASTIRCNFQFIKLIIIDEISMVGSNMFHKIDTRLRQIFGINKDFGGMSIITVGDLYQLPPVLDKLIYKHPSDSALAKLSPYTLWDQFHTFTLTQIMRQKNDIPFINVLNNIAKGKTTEFDCKLINTRTTLENNIPTDIIRLYSTNKSVDEYNIKKIISHPGKLIVSISTDNILDPMPQQQKQKLLLNMKTKKRQEFGGLHYDLQLKIGIKYMITKNIDVEDGLVNGAYGILQWIDYKNNIEPTTLWIDFGKNKKIGNKAKKAHKLSYPETDEKNLIPIQKTTVTNTLKSGVQESRYQFPITPAEAITIHKSQGETYDNVCLDVTQLNNKFTTNSLLYVAFSRVRCLENLYIIGEFNAIQKNTKTVKDISNQLNNDKQLQLSLKFDFTDTKLSIIYHSVRSFKQNFSYIVHDEWYSQTDLIILSETYSKACDTYNLNNYQLVYFSNIDDQKSKGISCFLKKGLHCKIINKQIYTELHENKVNHVELILLQIQKYYILTGYKSPSTMKTLFVKILNLFHLEKICSNHFILIGDFNFDCYDEKNCLNDILIPYSLKRGLSTGITTTNFNTQIDVIYLSIDITEYKSGTYESFFLIINQSLFA